MEWHAVDTAVWFAIEPGIGLAMKVHGLGYVEAAGETARKAGNRGYCIEI
jgi:hypothetical protein